MKPGRRARLESQLSAYLDGELAPVERWEVEELLEADPGARALLEELRAAARLLHDLPRATAGPRLAEGVRTRLERKALLGDSASLDQQPSTVLLGRGRTLAAAAVIALTVTTGYLLWSFREPPGRPITAGTPEQPAPRAEARGDRDDSPLALGREGTATIPPGGEIQMTAAAPRSAPPPVAQQQNAPPAVQDALAAENPEPAETPEAPAAPSTAPREQAVIVELAYADALGRQEALRTLARRRNAAAPEVSESTAGAAAGKIVDVTVGDAAEAMQVLADLSRTRPLTMRLAPASEGLAEAELSTRAPSAVAASAAGDVDHSAGRPTGLGFLETARLQAYIERLRRVLETAPAQRARLADAGDHAAVHPLPAPDPPQSAPQAALAQADDSPPAAREEHVPEPAVAPAVNAPAAPLTAAPSAVESVAQAAGRPSTAPAAPPPEAAAVSLRVRIRWTETATAPGSRPPAP